MEEKNLTKLVFVCELCKGIFKEAGLCPKCSLVLKTQVA